MMDSLTPYSTTSLRWNNNHEVTHMEYSELAIQSLRETVENIEYQVNELGLKLTSGEIAKLKEAKEQLELAECHQVK